MKNRPRSLQKEIVDYAFDRAKVYYPTLEYDISKVGDTIYIDKPFPDGTFSSMVILTIDRG